MSLSDRSCSWTDRVDLSVSCALQRGDTIARDTRAWRIGLLDYNIVVAQRRRARGR
jgi:hypothetical protein